MVSSTVNASTATYCYIDLDFDNYREKLSRCAAFVAATDSRYGFSSSDLRQLGGSELARIPDLIQVDHEWNNNGRSAAIIQVKPPHAGNRIVVKLYWDVAPMACENFATLCYNGSSNNNNKPAPISGESGKALTYRKSTVHRIEPGFVLQAGDFVKGNGSSGESIYNGKKFKDERPGLLLEHDQKGTLSMGNSGKNSNSSQFFMTLTTTTKTPHQCNGKHVVFGKVVSGFSVLDHAETFGSTDGTPTVPVTITDCGLLTPYETPGAGYWFDQPDDEAYSGISPIFMVRPRVAVVAPTAAVVETFKKALGSFCTVVAVFSTDEHNNNKDDDDEQSIGNSIPTKLKDLLDNFGVDVILVAPACRDVMVELLPSQQDHVVVLETKPVGALAAVRTQSWLSRESHLDGASR